MLIFLIASLLLNMQYYFLQLRFFYDLSMFLFVLNALCVDLQVGYLYYQCYQCELVVGLHYLLRNDLTCTTKIRNNVHI